MSEILLERPKEYLSLAEIAGVGNEGRFLRISPDGTRIEPVSLLDLRDVGIHGLTTGMVRLYEDGSVDGHSGQAFTRRGIIGLDSSGYVTSVIAGYDSTGSWWFNPNATGDKLVWASSSPGPDWAQVEPGEAVFGKGLITSELLVTPIDWKTQITGAEKPEDYATKGATWGSDINGQPADPLLLNELNGIGGYQGVPLPNEGGQPVPIDVYVDNDANSNLWFKVFEVDLTGYNYGACTWNGIFSWGRSRGRFANQMRVRISVRTGASAEILEPSFRYSGEDLTNNLKFLYDGNVCQVWVYLAAWRSCLFNGAWTARCDAGKSWIKTSQTASDGQTTAPTGTFVTPEYNYELGATVGATWGSDITGQPSDPELLNATQFIEPCEDTSVWGLPSGNSIALSSDKFSGAYSVQITWIGTSNPASSGTTGGAYLTIPERIALGFANKRIKVTVYAKQPSSNASSSFAVAYSTSDVGNSGWQSFTPTTSWAPYSFVYDVPVPNAGGTDFLGIWADTSNSGKSILIDNIVIESFVKDGEIDALSTTNAPAEAGATLGAPDSTPLGGMTVQDSVTGDGVFFTANGIEGWKSGSRTFLLDATTGDAIFSGTITAAVVDAGQLLVENGGNIQLDSNSSDMALLGFSYESDVLGSITAKNAAKIDFSPDLDNQRYLDIGNSTVKWKELDIYAYELWFFGDFIRFYSNNPPIFPYGSLLYYTSTPSTYAGGGVLYLDTSDSRLKMRLDDGSIKVIQWT